MKLLFNVLIAVSAGTLVSCQSTDQIKPSAQASDSKLKLDELVLGKPTRINEFLPVAYPVKAVLAQDENGVVLTKNALSYKAWDFNHDGRVDYVEALDNKNEVVYRVVDIFGEAKVFK